MLDETTQSESIPPPMPSESEAVMAGQERWEEFRRLFFEEKVAIAEIARRLAIDRAAGPMRAIGKYYRGRRIAEHP